MGGDKTIAGIVLAAGRGTRIGRPKALLRWGAETFVSRAARTWGRVCSPVVVVGGASFDELKRQVAPPALAVFNPSYLSGMWTSVQTGVGALTGGAFSGSVAAALIGPVDQALVDTRVLSGIVEAWRKEPNAAVVPTFEGRPGHPVLLPSSLFGDIIASPEWWTLQRFLDPERFLDRDATATGEPKEPRVRRVELGFPEIVRNINTPEDYRRFMQEAIAQDRGDEGVI